MMTSVLDDLQLLCLIIGFFGHLGHSLWIGYKAKVSRVVTTLGSMQNYLNEEVSLAASETRLKFAAKDQGGHKMKWFRRQAGMKVSQKSDVWN